MKFFDQFYWRWRFSDWSKPYYKLKTFIHLHRNAHKIAIALDNATRALGSQINHTESHKAQCKKCKHDFHVDCVPDAMVIKTKVRGKIIAEARDALRLEMERRLIIH